MKTFLLWALAAFLALFAVPFFPSFSSLLFLLSAFFAAPVSKTQDFLRARGLRTGVRALLTAAIFIAGLLSVPARPASNAAQSPEPVPASAVAQSPEPVSASTAAQSPTREPPRRALPDTEDEMSEVAAPFWNADSMGNDPNVLLSGGKLYSRNGWNIFPKENFSAYVVNRGSEDSREIGRSMSYINVWDEKIFYRDDATRHIRAYDMKTATDTELLDVNAGEVFLSEGRLFFSDLGQGASLFRASLDGSGVASVVLRSTGSFAVTGNRIFYLGNDQTLYAGTLAPDGSIADTPVILASNIERFFLTEKGLLLESGNTIFKILPDGAEASIAYRSDNETMRLVGAFKEAAFYQENGSLYLAGEEPTLIASTPCLYYTSPVLDGDGQAALIAYGRPFDGTGVRGNLLSIPPRSE